MTRHDLFTDLLTALQVPHTAGYSMRRYDEMPFQSLFGLSKLLEEYGIESRGLRFDGPGKMRSLPRPYVAATTDGVCRSRSGACGISARAQKPGAHCV